MVFMNFWYIEHYGASFGDCDAVMNYLKHIKKYNAYKLKNLCIVVINYFSKARYLFVL